MNYIDEVLARAKYPNELSFLRDYPCSKGMFCPNHNCNTAHIASAIRHGSQDVPELCARLKKAIEMLRDPKRSLALNALADELEAPIGRVE